MRPFLAFVDCGPQVTVRHLTAADIFLVLASDGVWEFMNNEEAGTNLFF